MMTQEEKTFITNYLFDHEERIFKIEVIVSKLLRKHPELIKEVEDMGFKLVPDHHD